MSTFKYNPHLNAWTVCDETEVVDALADFPITLEEVKNSSGSDGTVLHTPLGRFRVTAPGSSKTSCQVD